MNLTWFFQEYLSSPVFSVRGLSDWIINCFRHSKDYFHVKHIDWSSYELFFDEEVGAIKSYQAVCPGQFGHVM